MTQHDTHRREVAEALARLTGQSPMTENTALATELTDAATALDAATDWSTAPDVGPDIVITDTDILDPEHVHDGRDPGGGDCTTCRDDAEAAVRAAEPTTDPPWEVAELDPEASDITEVADWFEVYKIAKEAEREARERAAEAYAIVTSKPIEEGREFGTINGQRVLRYRPIVSRKFNSKAFREVHNDLYEAFREEKTDYRLDIL